MLRCLYFLILFIVFPVHSSELGKYYYQQSISFNEQYGNSIDEYMRDFLKQAQFEYTDGQINIVDDAYKFPEEKMNLMGLDLLIETKLTKDSDKELQLELNIFNKKGSVVFKKVTIQTFNRFKEIHFKLKEWMFLYIKNMPPVGKIIRIANNKILVKVNPLFSYLDLSQRKIAIGKLQFTSGFGVADEENIGNVTRNKGSGYLEGYIFDKFLYRNYKQGDHVIFLHQTKSSSNSVATKQKLNISETYFNYLNKSNNSMLDCTLLPILSNSSAKDPFFKYLKEEMEKNYYCKLRINQRMDSLLASYGDKLDHKLKNPEVLKLIAKNLNAGSLIRVSAKELNRGVTLSVEMIAENGRDILFSKLKVIDEWNNDLMVDLVKGWVDEFRASLPFHGKVIEIINGQIIMDIPKSMTENSDQYFAIYRPVSVRVETVNGQKVVSWRKEKVASGEIDRVYNLHSKGILRDLVPGQTVKIGDWVQLVNFNELGIKKGDYFSKHNLKNKRKTGRFKLATEFYAIGSSRDTETVNQTGLNIGLDYYLPYGLLGIFEATRIFGSSDNSISNNQFAGAIGYSHSPRWLPFFSLIDYYVGYRVTNYSFGGFNIFMDAIKYSGPYLGAKVEFPVYRKFDLQAEVNFSPLDSSSTENSLIGAPRKSTALGFKLLGKFKFWKDLSVMSEFHFFKYSSVMDLDDINLTVNAKIIRLGLVWDF